MTVSLRPVDQGNYRECIELSVDPGQQRFVASNVQSLADAYVWRDAAEPHAVYAGDDLVGFAMYGQHPDTGAWWVIRLMIAPEHQGRGYGRAAMETMIDLMVERIGCEEIVTSFVPGNTVAAALYESLGFRPTGEEEDGEPLLLLRLADRH
jgi:diamine N-acetyltransferase